MLEERAGPPWRRRWVRNSEARETRERLSRALKGSRKFAHPFRAWRLHRARRAASERAESERRHAETIRELEARIAAMRGPE